MLFRFANKMYYRFISVFPHPTFFVSLLFYDGKFIIFCRTSLSNLLLPIASHLVLFVLSSATPKWWYLAFPSEKGAVYVNVFPPSNLICFIFSCFFILLSIYFRNTLNNESSLVKKLWLCLWELWHSAVSLFWRCPYSRSDGLELHLLVLVTHLFLFSTVWLFKLVSILLLLCHFFTYLAVSVAGCRIAVIITIITIIIIIIIITIILIVIIIIVVMITESIVSLRLV